VSDEGGAKGDLRAVVKVVAPTELSGGDQDALRELGKRLPNPRDGAPWR
jgi:hypothetical protein